MLAAGLRAGAGAGAADHRRHGGARPQRVVAERRSDELRVPHEVVACDARVTIDIAAGGVPEEYVVANDVVAPRLILGDREAELAPRGALVVGDDVAGD